MIDGLPRRDSKSKVDIPSFMFLGTFCVGKTTYSDNLKALMEKTFGIPVYRPSFSAKIEEIAREFFGMKEYDRQLLQDIGTKMRDLDPAVWAKYLIREIKTQGMLPFVCDGVRKPEELAVFKEEIPNLIVIRLEAGAQELLEAYKGKYGHYPTTEEMTNIAERSIPNLAADMILFNSYKMNELERQIGEIVKAIQNNGISDFVKGSK